MYEPTGWHQPSDYRGQLPGAPDWTWTNLPDDTQEWPEKRKVRPVLVPEYKPDWRDTRLVRTALAAFCLAAIVACLTVIFVAARVVLAIWPK